MIVLWCAICLHARWGKVVSERTQMVLAVGGNIITSWTLFGVNILGVGLHSYGWVQGTFWLLIGFWLTRAPHYWRGLSAAAVLGNQGRASPGARRSLIQVDRNRRRARR